VRTDPQAALDYWIKTDPEAQKDSAGTLVQLAGNWAHHDPHQALAWARQIGDEKLRGNLLGSIIGTIAHSEPEHAVSLIAQLPPASQSAAAAQVALRWANNDPVAASAWIGQLPEGDTRTSAARSVAAQWAGEDPVAATGWLERLPTGATRDAAVSAFTQQAVGSDPEGAAAWASTIADANTRNNSIEGIARQWLRTDKKSAVKWINQSPAISAEMKQRLLPKN
jgi:hypothetical protein